MRRNVVCKSFITTFLLAGTGEAILDATTRSEVNIAVNGNGELTREPGHTSEVTKSDQRSIEVNEQGKVVELSLDASAEHPGHSTIALKANHGHHPADRSSWMRMLDPTANLLLQVEEVHATRSQQLEVDAGPQLDELEAITIASLLTKKQSTAQPTSLVRADRESDLEKPALEVEMSSAVTSGLPVNAVMGGGAVIGLLIVGFLFGFFDKYLPKFITDRFRSDGQIERDTLAANRH